MAIVKFGPTVTDVRGTIAGTIFSGNKSGPYARGWAKSSNPRTDVQLERRGVLANIAQAWTGLTAGQRAGWDTWAALAFNERTNSVGELYFPSGFNQFCRVNSIRDLGGAGIRSSAPPAVAIAAAVLTALTVVRTGTVSAIISFPAGEYAADWLLIELAFARGKAAQPNIGNYRFMKLIQGFAGTTIDFTTEMQAVFGDPTVGSIAHGRFRRCSGVLVDGPQSLLTDEVA